MNPDSPTLAVGRSLAKFLVAVHAARILVGIVSVSIAIVTRDEIPTGQGFAVGCAVAGLVWTVGVAIAWPAIERSFTRHPALLWVDGVVLIGLMLVNKPWDSNVALPYGAFVLLVPYARPLHLAVLVVATSVVQYLPKLVLTSIDWRFAERVPPTTTTEWFTIYVGPLFCGTVAWALCLLFHGIRSEAVAWEAAQSALAQAEARSSHARTRRALANRLHETLSQVVRAIPLGLDGPPPAGLNEQALAARRTTIEVALDARPGVQQVARELRGEVPE